MRHTPHEQYSKPSSEYFGHDGHCVVLRTSPNSYNSKFLYLWLVFSDSSLNLLNFPFSLKSAMTDSVWYSDRSLSTNSWLSVILPWSSITSSCGSPWIVCLPAAVSDCQASLRTFFGARRGVEALCYKKIFSCRDTTFSMQSASTESWKIMARDLVCQDFNPFSCVVAKWIQ